MLRILTVIVAALAVAPFTAGHTWIEQLRSIDDKGSYVGEYGYPRGMVPKGTPEFSGKSMNWEIPAYQGGKVHIDETIVLCHPDQRKQKQSSDQYPRLQATPGGFIAMRYTENGHITKPYNQIGKPEKGGTIFVYGTTEPKEDEKIVDVLQWTQDGKGGDKRGMLLAMNDYDDGQCYEVNNTPIHDERAKQFPAYAAGQAVADGAPGTFQRYCETDVKLPESAQMGKPYTFYWLWQWPTATGGVDPTFPEGKDEYYSTCIDVDVASKDVALAADAPKAAMPQQDNVSQAVPDWASRTALMTDAIKGEVGPYFQGNQTHTSKAPGATPAPQPPVSTRAPQASASPPTSPPAPAQSSKAPAQSSKAPAQSSKAPASPVQSPAQSVTTVTLKPSSPVIPTLTGRPGSAPPPSPSPQPSSGNGNAPEQDGDDAVTLTDTVYLTITASNPAESPAVSSQRPVNSVTAPSAKVSSPAAQPTPRTAQPTTLMTVKSSQQAPASAAPSGNLGGFNMGNPNGAKFRRVMSTQ